MTDTSRSRADAEVAFGKTTSQLLARARIVSERDTLVQARDEKTERLRELRLAKAASEPTPPVASRAKRSAKR